MGSKLEGALSRGDTWSFDPEFLVVVEDSTHPLYDERVHMPLSEPFLDSVRAHGVKEPILVRRNGVRKDGSAVIEVLDGRQRVRAARAVNKERKKAGVEPLRVQGLLCREDDDQAMETMILTNEQRVNDDVVTRAEKLRRYLDRGRSEQDASIAFGLTARELAKLLTVLDLDKTAKAALKADSITFATAAKLAKLPRSAQAVAVERIANVGGKRKAARVAAEATGEGRVPRMRTANAVRAYAEKLRTLPTNPRIEGAISFAAWVLGETDAIRES